MSTTASIRVAAVQMCAVLGDVESGCAAAEGLARQAFASGAEWVILPEFFPSAVAFHPALLDAARPADGAPYQLLRRLAREHAGVVGGSFICGVDGGARNRFVLAFPDGSTFFHDKDLPTMWEGCYYEGGTDDGVLETARGNVGVAMCWELIRSQTPRRLLGRVDLVVGGSCWWDLPDDAEGPEADSIRVRLRGALEEAPGALAQMLGVPMVHAAHAGTFEGQQPPSGESPYRSRFLGGTRIVDGSGELLASLSPEEGEGFALADVTPGVGTRTLEPVPESFWIPDLPQTALEAWEWQNAFARDYYERVTRPYRAVLASGAPSRSDSSETIGKERADGGPNERIPK